ncbi:MAG: CbiX/SirB N-terminal domain-containing protein [Polyangiaceae bacterium]
MAKQAILVVDHGSRRPEANALLDGVVARIRASLGDEALIAHAHMELATPSLAEAFAACVAAGAEEVVVVPFFLGPGRHVTEDIPRLAAEAAALHPGVRHRVTAALGDHPLIAEAVIARARG